MVEELTEPKPLSPSGEVSSVKIFLIGGLIFLIAWGLFVGGFKFIDWYGENVIRYDGDLCYKGDYITGRDSQTGLISLHYSPRSYYGRDSSERVNSLGKITDLTCIEKLSIHLDEIGQAHNFSHLSSFENLVHLETTSSWLNDISFLSDLKKLKHLEISLNHVNDFSPFYDLENLEYLEIRGIDAPSEKFLESQTNLETLWLWFSSDIDKIEGIPHLSNLKELRISLNQVGDNRDVEDIGRLGELTSLEKLHLETKVDNLDFLKNLPNLKELTLEGMMDNVSALYELKNLERLTINLIRNSDHVYHTNETCSKFSESSPSTVVECHTRDTMDW